MGYTGKVVVVGAGISGLACAYRLKQLGIPCLVLEARERAGGVIASIRRNGFLFETGPQCPRFPPSVWQLVRELNLETEFVPGDTKANRYILRDGQLHRAPFSPGGLLATRLLGAQSKLRILTEVFRSSQPPPEEESLAEFVQRKFGLEVLDYLVDPLVSTIFFGDARQMGMESAFPALVEWEKKHGSLVRGAIHARNSKKRDLKTDSSTNSKRGSLRVTDALPSLGSFRSGMAALPEKLAASLQEGVRYNAGIERLEQVRNADGPMNASWEIVLSSGEKIKAGHLILAVPAYVAARFLANTVPQLANSLEAIEYAPACAVSSAYQRAQLRNPLDGFGYMIPRREGLQTICTFWNSSLFPGRAPEGNVLITSFAGRELHGRELHGRDTKLDEENLTRTVEAENALTLGINGPPIDRVVWTDARALPQYNIGHARRVSEIQNILRTIPNLKIVSNFLKGRSIGDCVDLAYSAAQDIHSDIQEGNI